MIPGREVADPELLGDFLVREPRGDGFEGYLEYSADLFDAETARAMARHLETLAAAMVRAPDAPVDSRVGKAGLRVHVPWSSGNFFLFADASRSLTSAGSPRNLIETGSLGLKADVTLLGWNLGLVGNFGGGFIESLMATVSVGRTP